MSFTKKENGKLVYKDVSNNVIKIKPSVKDKTDPKEIKATVKNIINNIIIILHYNFNKFNYKFIIACCY